MNKFLQKHQQNLVKFAKKNQIKYLALFGSYARGGATANSDVDLLVEFKNDADLSLFDVIAVEHAAENLLKKNVDLIPKDSLDKYIAPYIQDDLTVIYEETT